jgi:hypothetical protein
LRQHEHALSDARCVQQAEEFTPKYLFSAHHAGNMSTLNAFSEIARHNFAEVCNSLARLEYIKLANEWQLFDYACANACMHALDRAETEP